MDQHEEVKPIQCQMILKNPFHGMVKSDIGKPTQKKEALTLEQQKRFVRKLVRNQSLERRKPYKKNNQRRLR